MSIRIVSETDTERVVEETNEVGWVARRIESKQPAPPDAAEQVAATLRAVNEGRATDEQIAQVAEIIAGVGGG